MISLDSLDSLPHLPGCYLFLDGPDDSGNVRQHHLRRQSQRPQEAGRQLFSETGSRPQNSGAGAGHKGSGLHRHQHRGRGPAPGEHPHQEASAPLQHQAQRLLTLRLHPSYRREVSEDQNLPQGTRARAHSMDLLYPAKRGPSSSRSCARPLACARASACPSEPACATTWATAQARASARSPNRTTTPG